MPSSILLQFNRDIKNTADIKEQLGNICLSLFRSFLGASVDVAKISLQNSSLKFSTTTHSKKFKLLYSSMFVMGLPITAPIAALGAYFTLRSKSHQRIYQLYEAKKKSCDRIETKEEKAAIIIQKHVRGFLGRKSFLPLGLHLKLKSAIAAINKSTQRAFGGKTPVYLPKIADLSLDVIFKKTGVPYAISRFDQMQYVRKILRKQGCDHLVIPKVNLCGEFLVEQKLPIHGLCYHNMGIYLNHIRSFDAAVKELVGLFSEIRIYDLVYRCPTFSLNLHSKDLVRYDNLPLYIDESHGERVGKIGLIDLELLGHPSAEGLYDLARIFPYHLEIIHQQAHALGIDFDFDELKNSAIRGDLFLQKGYREHLDWIENHDKSSKFNLTLFAPKIELSNLNFFLEFDLRANDQLTAGKILTESLLQSIHDHQKKLFEFNSFNELDRGSILFYRTVKISLPTVLTPLSTWVRENTNLQLTLNASTKTYEPTDKMLFKLLAYLKESNTIFDFQMHPYSGMISIRF